MRKKFGFKDFIAKSLPLNHPTIENLSKWVHYTRKNFSPTNLNKGDKCILYLTKNGELSSRRTKRPKVAIFLYNLPSGFAEFKVSNSLHGTYLALHKEIFFYEEEKALGKLPEDFTG